MSRAANQTPSRPQLLLAAFRGLFQTPAISALFGNNQIESFYQEYQHVQQVLCTISGGHSVALSEVEESSLSDILTSVFNQPSLKEAVINIPLTNSQPKNLDIMNTFLAMRTFFFQRQLTVADVAVYIHFRCCSPIYPSGLFPTEWSEKYPHVQRWYSFMHQNKPMRSVLERNFKGVSNNNNNNNNNNKQGSKPTNDSGASYEGVLVGAVDGQVVTRFPPEPSGYLHIGHAKAALLNSYFAKKYNGKLIFRFDDTNPAKENSEFEDSIIEDVKLIGVKWDKLSHTSDYFETLLQVATRAISEGIFYVDDTPTEILREERGEGIESKSRQLSPAECLKRWEEMQKGTPEGVKCCVRAKIDMQCKNKCMRDPVMYRVILEPPHHIHGNKYRVYPTYDFACPLVDAIEGVTHALRTSEYSERIPQYHWIQKALGFRHVEIYEFSRLAFVRTLLSKRKLLYFVENKHVEGWDDPRMPTVRGILRRGLQMPALLEFILLQGPSKASTLMEWDKLWAINKQLIDPQVPRYMAVADNAVEVIVKGAPEKVEYIERSLHAKNPNLGKVRLALFNSLWIEHDDAMQCTPGEEVTLMHWGNAIFNNILVDPATKQILKIEATLNLEGDFKKTKKKLNWVAKDGNHVPCILREYDHLITVDKLDKESDQGWESIINSKTLFDTVAFGDFEMQRLKIGDTLQLERRGYFRVDTTSPQGLILVKIPDGKSKAVSAISSKVDAATLSGGKKRPTK